MPKEKLFDRPFVFPALILACSFVLAASIAAYAVYAIRGFDSTLSTTGSATELVKADTAKWRISIYRSAPQSGIPGAYAQIAKDIDVVKAHFTTNTIAAEKIIVGATVSDQIYNNDSNAPQLFNVHAEMTIESNDVDKVEELSHRIGVLLAKGVQVSPQQPEYYVSTLPELRITLLGKAIADAKARAVQLAKNGDTAVGALKSASSGVVQVLAPNSTNVEDYGSYDTTTIQKQVMVTTRATFYAR